MSKAGRPYRTTYRVQTYGGKHGAPLLGCDLVKIRDGFAKLTPFNTPSEAYDEMEKRLVTQFWQQNQTLRHTDYDQSAADDLLDYWNDQY